MGGMVIIEFDSEPGKVSLVFQSNSFDQRFRTDTFLLGAQHYRRSVGVVSANIIATVPTHFLKSHPNIGLQIFDEMADMNRAIGVWQGARYEYLSFFGGHFSLVCAGSVDGLGKAILVFNSVPPR
jgi:hypothetical protein